MFTQAERIEFEIELDAELAKLDIALAACGAFASAMIDCDARIAAIQAERDAADSAWASHTADYENAENAITQLRACIADSEI